METTATHTTRAVRRKAQRKVARQVASGRYTLADLGRVYGVPASTIYRWSKGALPRAGATREILWGVP